MKKSTLCTLTALAMSAFLIGCGEDSLREPVKLKSYDIEKEQTDEIQMPLNTPAAVSSAPNTEISHKELTVQYAGEAFTKSVFATGGSMLYLYGIRNDGSFFLGRMGKEEDVFAEFIVEMDDGMRVFSMAVDEKNRCHMLWMSVVKTKIGDQIVDRIAYDKSYITVIDADGRLEEKIDVSDIFSSEQPRPYCFVIDREGNYYFENNNQVVQILKDGTQGITAIIDGAIEGLGMGKSGTIYCTYQEKNGDVRLAKLEKDILYPCETILPPAKALYAGIYPGTDSELLLLNKAGGIYTSDEKHTNLRVSTKELPVEGQDIAGYGVLTDGRVCIMHQANESTVFYYIPAGK